MDTFKTNQNSSDFKEYVRDLLECPVCMDVIKSVPVYQCANGHVICTGCIEKLNNCPICRSDSSLVRILILEVIKPENVETTTATPNLTKWGKRSESVYRTINDHNQETRIDLNLQAIPEPSYSAASETANEVIRNILMLLFICFNIYDYFL